MKRAFVCFQLLMVFMSQSAPMPAFAGDKPLAFDSAAPPVAKFLTLLRVTPEGNDVPPGRQIVFQFDRAVVPVGRMERDAAEIPIEIGPALQCEWRWINTSALACQLTEQNALRHATRYTLRVEPGIKAEDGSQMEQPYVHSFVTERPKVTYPSFETWRAAGWPRIRLTFNQPVTRSSVEQHVDFETSSEEYGIRITPAENDRSPIVYAPFPGEPYGMLNPEYASRTLDDRKTMVRGEEARRIWMVEPRQELPLDSTAYLRVKPGLVSALGPEAGIESRYVVEFRTYPEFSFLGVECGVPSTEKSQLVAPAYKSGAKLPEDVAQCLPDHGVALVFSAPVINQEIKHNVRFTPDLGGGRKDYDPWANSPGYSSLQSPHRENRKYRVYLPEMLKAFHRYEITSVGKQVKDEFGRPLPEPIDMAFMTSHRLPNLVLDHDKAVLEKQVDTEVPVYITNLDILKVPHKTVTLDGISDNPGYQIELEEAEDVAYARRLDVRKMLHGKSGAVVGRLDSKPEVKHNYLNRFSFFAQVTPFQVHVKLGHFNSLAWITDLASGEPVAGARVAIYSDNYSLDNAIGKTGAQPASAGAQKEKSLGEMFSERLQNFMKETPFGSKYPEPEGTLASAVSGSDGIALLPGIETLNPDLSLLRYYGNDDRQRLFVRVDKDEDFALMPLDQDFMTRGGVYSNNRPKNGHLYAWGTTAQGVYKAGDTIQYKLYVRNQDNRHWIAPPATGYSLEIIDPKGEKVMEIEALELSRFGAYAGEFKVGSQAAVGWYRFKLKYADQNALEPMRVMVADFTPAPFRVTTDLSGKEFEPGDEIAVTTIAQLHAGGPYAQPRTRTTVRLQRQTFQSQNARAKNFIFDRYSNHQNEFMLHQSSDTGNDRGETAAHFTLQDQNIYYGRILAEGAVRDDRGKFVAAQTGAGYYGRDRYVGLRNTAWTYEEDKNSAIEYIVVDRAGAPTAGTQVTIKIEREQIKASRVKGAGNAYLTNYIKEWVGAGVCQDASTLEAQTCAFTPQEPGSYRFTATILDGKKREHSSQIMAWVIGKGRVYWQEPDNYSLEILPEETEYKVGETARFLVKNPFPGAKALIAIERYGVLKHWMQTLEESTPIIEVPIEPDYLHGFYLSVLINSPRVEKPSGEGNVDLGKPTFRLGYIRVPVKDPYKEIEIQISPEREVYKPREKVKTRIAAKPRQGTADRPLEIAALVIDEAVFDLNAGGRGYYDPYQGFNRLDGLDLNNYSLLTRLVGRQKFEKKGANPGGDGEAGGESGPTLRNLFKFVSYWNPSIIPDKNGNADIEFELPDNLTGWRVFALAVTPDDRMGLGDAAIKVNQPTELRPVMPNQVTEGDAFVAGFSVMNRTEKPRTVSVEISAAGAVDAAGGNRSMSQLTLEPYKRQTVWLPVKTKDAGVIEFRASARDDRDGDAIAYQVTVNKRRSLVTAANYGTTTGEQTADAIAFPKDVYSDTGRLSVVTSPSVIGNIEGAFGYIRDYPYWCWEQRLTKAVMASHYNNLGAYLPGDLLWADSKTLPQDMLDSAGGFQAPNGGMTFWLPENEYVSPYLSAYTALAFNWLRKSGYTVPPDVERKLHGYLGDMLRHDVMPTFFSEGMASSVRAIALAALAEHGSVGLAELTRHESHLPEMDLFGKAHFLMAATRVDGGRSTALKTTKLILNYANQSGGKFQFNEPWDDSYLYLLSTPLRSNCAILSGLMQLTTDAETLGMVGDIPFKQVRAITQSRGNRDHWENTQENAFCMNALTDYARVYENEKPDMTVRVSVGPRKIGETRYTDLRDKAATFDDPVTKASPGFRTQVTIDKKGPGRIYYSTRMSYAPTIENSQPIHSGIEIRREYSVERNGSWTLLESPMQIKRGELVRIDIFASLPTARHFVVVDDPVPGGLEPVNRDLATTSAVDADKGRFQAARNSFWFHYGDWSSYGAYGYSFYHKELRHDSARFYADYLPAGNYHLSYTAQAIVAGDFSVMPVHAEEMYDPDVFGKGLWAILKVSQE